MDNKHGGKKSQRTRFCTWKLTEEREKKSSVPCVPFVKWKKTPIHFRFPAFNPRDFSARRRLQWQMFGIFWPVLHWQANKLQNNFIWMPKKSCDSRLLPQESVQHFFSIHQTHKGLLCRVFFFCCCCCCYGLCLNQPKMSAYLTSFARLARLYTVIAICNIALSVYYQFFAFRVLLPLPLLRAL